MTATTILADVMEIPNLRQKATSILSRKMSQWFLGMEPQEDPFLPQRNQALFALYSVAAAAYRWVVALSICWFLYKLFQSYEVKIIGQIVVLMSLYGLFVMPLYQAGKFFYVPGRLDQVKKSHFYTSLGGLIALVAAVLFLPLPCSVMCTLEIQPRDAHPVYVEVAGTLSSIDAKPGQQVAAKQRLGQLQSPDLDLEIADLEGTVNQYRARLKSIGQQVDRDPTAAEQIPQAKELLKTAEDELAKKQLDKGRLRLVAPVAGTVLPPPLTERREDGDEQLLAWAGTPLDRENLGAHLESSPSVLFCQIGDPKCLEAVLVIDQTDFNIVRMKQKVDVKMEGLPALTLHGKIEEIAPAEMKVTPRRLSNRNGGELPSKMDPHTGIEKPMSASYQARVPLDDPNGVISLGQRGQARVYTDWVPLGTRIWRLLTHTFNFKL